MQKPTKDTIALILGGVFVLGLVFATYTYFNKGPDQTNNTDLSQDEKNSINKIKDTISTSTQRDENTSPSVISGSVEQPQTEWVATDYAQGDIKGSTYTVKIGDTLWEIAEGIYGNGAEWVKILQANIGSIGFLANDSQVLIVPGQVLVLP